MSVVVRFKLYGPEAEVVNNFARQIGVPIDTVAKQSLFMTISRALKSANDLEKQMAAEAAQKLQQQEGDLDGQSRDVARDTEATLERGDAPTDALASAPDDTIASTDRRE